MCPSRSWLGGWQSLASQLAGCERDTDLQLGQRRRPTGRGADERCLDLLCLAGRGFLDEGIPAGGGSRRRFGQQLAEIVGKRCSLAHVVRVAAVEPSQHAGKVRAVVLEIRFAAKAEEDRLDDRRVVEEGVRHRPASYTGRDDEGGNAD